MMLTSDLPPSLRAVITDLDCIAEDGEIDEGIAYYMSEYAAIDLEIDTPESKQWINAAIEARPGVWVARLCRAMHDLPETEASIIFCGRCTDYANPNKRARAKRYAELPMLPGFEAPYQLHPPCSKRGFGWLRSLVRRMAKRQELQSRREKIPDVRQPRGWDWASRLYRKEKTDA